MDDKTPLQISNMCRLCVHQLMDTQIFPYFSANVTISVVNVGVQMFLQLISFILWICTLEWSR